MPNWCMNHATFEHDDDALLQRLVDAFNSGSTMQEFWPCPQELRDTAAGYLGNTDAQKELEQKEVENVKKYGDKNWYDWCVNNWSTKWDFGRDQDVTLKNDPRRAVIAEKNGRKYVEIGFDTAWSPPLGFYEYMHTHHGFKVEAQYFEPGMGFVGTSKNGDDNTISIREFTQEWLKNNVPERLCEIFNLYEQAAECEAAEKELQDNE